MANLLEKAVAYCVSVHSIGDKRKIDPERVDLTDNVTGTTPDKEFVGIQKKIFKSKAYDDIKALDRSFKSQFEKLALPSPFKRSIYLLPIRLIEKADKLMNEYKERRLALVENLVAVFESAIEEAKARLNGFFNIMDYPTTSQILSRFTVDASFVDFGVPTALEDVSPELMVREQQAMRDRMEKASADIQAAMRETFKELVEHMVDLLTPSADGKYKRFYESNLTNFKEFLSTFSDRNIVEDKELEGLVKKAQDIIGGADVSLLRNAEVFKQSIATSLGEVKTSLSSMVVSKGRKFDFSDDND